MNLRKVQYGDVISVERSVYDHYGIYSGNDKVIHYKKSNGKARIAETSLTDFLGEDTTYTIHCFPETKEGLYVLLRRIDAKRPTWSRLLDKWHIEDYTLYSPEETVARAREQIGKEDYNLFLSNCEHFAIWCKTGVEHSTQIDKLLDIIPNPMSIF